MKALMAHGGSVIAAEGWPVLIILTVAVALVWSYFDWAWASPIIVLTALAVLLFQDPSREIPPLPLGIVAPVDGRVLAINTVQDVNLPGRWTRIKLRANPWGAYTVRSPIEGTVLNVHEQTGNLSLRGLWVRSEENDDVVLLFTSRLPIFRPKAFVRFGERLGQGQRFAYQRLASAAELFIPATAALRVGVGERVKAGCDVIADLQDD